MAIKPIAKSYWRLIKSGSRTFDSVPDNVKEDVLTLAQQDVENGEISAEEYEALTGKTHVEG